MIGTLAFVGLLLLTTLGLALLSIEPDELRDERLRRDRR
jgi:hypothetical protein